MCIDHLQVGNLRICHVMDATTRYSAGTVVNGTGMEAAIGVVDSHWISPFWAPESIQIDQDFANKEFSVAYHFTALIRDRFLHGATIKMSLNGRTR